MPRSVLGEQIFRHFNSKLEAQFLLSEWRVKCRIEHDAYIITDYAIEAMQYLWRMIRLRRIALAVNAVHLVTEFVWRWILVLPLGYSFYKKSKQRTRRLHPQV